jgi:acyl carrier protein
VTASGPNDNDRIAPRDWVMRYLARLLEIDERHIDLKKSLGEFGLDSVDAMIMAGEFEEYFRIETDPSLFFDCETIQDLLDAWERGRGPA